MSRAFYGENDLQQSWCQLSSSWKCLPALGISWPGIIRGDRA